MKRGTLTANHRDTIRVHLIIGHHKTKHNPEAVGGERRVPKVTVARCHFFPLKKKAVISFAIGVGSGNIELWNIC